MRVCRLAGDFLFCRGPRCSNRGRHLARCRAVSSGDSPCRLPFVLFGLAVARTDTHLQWLGWVAAGAGAGSIGAGLFQAFTGKPTVASLVLTIIGPTVIVLWLLIMGVLLRRRSREVLLSQAVT